MMQNNEKNTISRLEHPDVQAVIQVAEELVENNQVIDIDLLYKFAKRKLNYKGQVLFSIIQLLIKEGIIVEGTKMVKDQVLLNENRSKIYEFIRAYPGVHFSIIKEQIFGSEDNETGSTGQFIWHIDILMKFRFIKRLEVMKYSLFLPYEMDDNFGTYFFLLRNRIKRKIVKCVDKEEKIEQAKIPDKILESKGTVYYHLKSLKEKKVVKSAKSETNNNTEVWLNPDKVELLNNIIQNIETNKY